MASHVLMIDRSTPRLTPAARGGLVALLVLMTLSSLLVPSWAQDTEEPLREEDIVRRFVTGAKTADLLELIRSSNVDFALEPGMLDELRLAGLADEVIDAMIARQAELHPEDAPELEEDEEPGDATGVRLVLHLITGPAPEGKEEGEEGEQGEDGGDDDTATLLRMVDLVPPEAAEAFGLKSDVSEFTDIALFVACHTSDHVPDHWRANSPLGRDFNSVSRHRMLLFQPGATLDEAPKLKTRDPRFASARVLEYDVPDRLELDLEPGVAHDLAFGVALQAGGRYYLLSGDEWVGLTLDQPGELDVNLSLPSNPLLPDIVVRFLTDSLR